MKILKLGGKEKPEFKVGDYVKVNDGTTLENGELIDNWVGKIVGIYPEYDTVEITFDAETLNKISDAYILDCYEDEGNHYNYVFYKQELTPIERRDTDEAYKLAVADYDLRFARVISDILAEEEIEKNMFVDEEDMRDKWFGLFSKSPLFEQLDDIQKENADFAIHAFINYLDEYFGMLLYDCTPDIAEDMCIDILPRKVSAGVDFFRGLASMLATFFEFLEENRYIPTGNGKAIKDALCDMDKKVLAASKDPQNWGMAKSMFMGAEEQGYDITDADDLNRFMQMQQLNALSNLLAEKSEGLRNLISENREALSSNDPFINQDPYKDFSRNTKVSVKYQGGKVKEYISFKRVEKDLRAGKCTLI